jgi:integrase
LEERKLLRVVRRLCPRDHALVATLWWTGFRISEALTLKVSQVAHGGNVLPKIGIRPRNLKGGYGSTRWVPVVPELARTFERHLRWLDRHYGLVPDLAVFPSRQRDREGRRKAIGRSQGDVIVRRAFARTGIYDDGRLGLHTLRKTWSRHVFRSAQHDPTILMCALGHSALLVTQRYLDVEEEAVLAAIRGADFTRRPRIRPLPSAPPAQAPAATAQSVVG